MKIHINEFHSNSNQVAVISTAIDNHEYNNRKPVSFQCRNNYHSVKMNNIKWPPGCVLFIDGKKIKKESLTS